MSTQLPGITGTWNGAVQTSYNVHPNQGVPGLMTHINEPREVWGYPVATGFLACGRAAARGDVRTMTVGEWGTTNSPYTIIPATAATTAADVLGIAVWDEAAEVIYEQFTTQVIGDQPSQTVTLPISGYTPGHMMTVMRRGYIWVRNYANTTADATVFMVINETNTLNAKFGEFVPTALDGAAIEMPGITWVASDIFAESKVAIVKVALA